MTRKKILLIDDDIDIHLILKHALTLNGFDCMTIFTVEEAVQRLKTEDFDLILLDLCFAPRNADGEAFLSHVRYRQESGHILPPIIVISGLNDREIIDYILDLGAVGYLNKPYNQETLLEMVQSYAW